MDDKKYREHCVNQIHEIANQITPDCDDRYIVDELINYAGDLRYKIDSSHKALYIAVFDNGPDDNFTRFYKPLGRITTEEAYNRLRKYSSGEGLEDRVMEVSTETYNNFIRAGKWAEIQSQLNSLKHFENIDDKLITSITDRITTIRNKCGLHYDWECVLSPY